MIASYDKAFLKENNKNNKKKKRRKKTDKNISEIFVLT